MICNKDISIMEFLAKIHKIVSFKPIIWNDKFIYCTRAIITHGLYIFYPIFEVHFFVFNEVFGENATLMYV